MAKNSYTYEFVKKTYNKLSGSDWPSFDSYWNNTVQIYDNNIKEEIANAMRDFSDCYRHFDLCKDVEKPLKNSFVDNLNWKHDNGINIFMLNDIQRNCFYDTILADSVNGKICVDIGFGTGLLSLIALKHGAKKVIGYESDNNRYDLGKYIIKKLNLEGKIELIHENFSHTSMNDNSMVYFSEIMCQNLWGEQLFDSLPRQKNIEFIPSTFFLEIHSIPISNSYKKKLLDFRDMHGFDPGIDINKNFVKLINSLGFDDFCLPCKDVTKGILEFEHEKCFEGYNSYLNLVNENTLAAYYSIDTKKLEITTGDKLGKEKKDLNFEVDEINLLLDNSNQNSENILIIPRVGCKTGKHKLYLDKGHWGPMNKPVILNQYHSLVKITHSLITGELTYTQEK